MGIEARAGRESTHDLQFSLTNMGMVDACMRQLRQGLFT